MMSLGSHRNTITISFGLAGLLVCGLALSQPADWRSRVSPGLELTSHLNDRLDIRFGIHNDRHYVSNARVSGLNDTDQTPVVSAMVDWSPYDGGFRMTGGATYGEDLFGESSIPMPEFSADDVQTYVGLGYDNDFGTQGRLGLSLDMGLTFDSVSGSTVDAVGDNDLENAELGSRFESFRYTPSFSAGVEYRF